MTLARDMDTRDEYGMTEQDWDELIEAENAHDKEQRSRALRALWLKPVLCEIRKCDGVVIYRDSREEEWTFFRAVWITIAILLNRRNTKDEIGESLDMAYWDALPTYGGYTVDRLWLYPNCTYSIFNDGECLM